MLYLPKVYYSENNISWYKHFMQFHNIDIFMQWNWRFWGFNPNVCQKRCLFDSYKNWKTAILHYMIGFSIEPQLTFNCSNQSIALIAYHFSINQSNCAELTKKWKKHLGIDVFMQWNWRFWGAIDPFPSKSIKMALFSIEKSFIGRLIDWKTFYVLS